MYRFGVKDNEFYTQHPDASKEVLAKKAAAGDVYVSPAKDSDATKQLTGITIDDKGDVTGEPKLMYRFGVKDNEFYTQHAEASKEILAKTAAVPDVHLSPAKASDATKQLTGITIDDKGDVTGEPKLMYRFGVKDNEFYTQHAEASKEVLAKKAAAA